MGIFGRIFRIIKGWLLIGVEKAEDPEVILAEARESMRRELDRAKEQAVQAIAARNQLRQVLTEQQNFAAGLEVKARQALKMGDEELARQMLVEKATYDQNITSLQEQLEQAEQASERVKEHIKVMEAKVRERAAQELALKAKWKQAKIQEQLNRALGDMSLDGQEQAFGRAEERIRQLQAKADARSELSEGTLSHKMLKLENTVSAGKADAALQAMKAEMGMLPSAAEDPITKMKAEIAAQNGANQPQQQVGTSQNGDGSPVRNIEV